MASVRAHQTTINGTHVNPFADLADPPLSFVQAGSYRGATVVSESTAPTGYELSGGSSQGCGERVQLGNRHPKECDSLEDGGISMPALGEGCWCVTFGGSRGYDGSPGRAD